MAVAARDIKGISKLPKILLISLYKISCIKLSSEIPLLSLGSSEIPLQVSLPVMSPVRPPQVLQAGHFLSDVTKLAKNICDVFAHH